MVEARASGGEPLAATELIERIRSGTLSPVEAVTDALTRAVAEERFGAVQLLCADEALAVAAELAGRAELATLPLAGLPILIKDNVPVAGLPMRDGSQATSDEPQAVDHELVARLRAAGAVIIGKTRTPELCVWGTTDSVFGLARNPWNPDRTPGGSSGGSAAAVAAGIVPVAHANDGMGSIRIPAANTGLFGIKPGSGVVPSGGDTYSWGGMSENGVVAARVRDAALVLSVMAADASLAEVVEPARPLRIAVASNTPSFLVSLSTVWRRALTDTAEALREAGHTVTETRFPYPANPIPLFARWFSGVADDAKRLDFSLLEPRTRRHAKLGLLAQRRGWVKAADRDRLEASTRNFFDDYDILLTPMLARTAPRAALWHRRSWLRNIWSNLRYAPFAAPWNMLGWPAASIPAGMDASLGMPTAVQAVAPPGGEAVLLGLAAQLERIRPWPRVASLSAENVSRGGR